VSQDSGSRESFVGEPVTPKPGTFDTAMMATGIPGLPHQFTWKGTEYAVAAVIETWKTLGPCTSGADEMYVRRHWYKIKTTTGEVMTLYCDRHAPRGKSKTKGRWVLYSIAAEGK
jgi:hypothetical protein